MMIPFRRPRDLDRNAVVRLYQKSMRVGFDRGRVLADAAGVSGIAASGELIESQLSAGIRRADAAEEVAQWQCHAWQKQGAGHYWTL